MKRLLIALVCFVALASPGAAFAKCAYDSGNSVLENLSQDGCKPTSSLTTGEDASISATRERVVVIANNIITIGSLLAVGAVVYSGILFIFSVGKDIKTAKNSLVYSLVGFAVMLLAFPIVNATVNLIFGLNH